MAKSYWDDCYLGQHPGSILSGLIIQAGLPDDLIGKTVEFVTQFGSNHIQVVRTVVTGASYSPDDLCAGHEALRLTVAAPSLCGHPFVELQFITADWAETDEPGAPTFTVNSGFHFHWRAKVDTYKDPNEPGVHRFYYGELTPC
jgi:hypothetical protein